MPRSKSVESSKSKKEISTTLETIDPFLMTFEKPTQIYRYLRTRFILSPLFLHRNLTYMKGRCKRPNRKRLTTNENNAKTKALLDICKKLETNHKGDSDLSRKINRSECLIIGFDSFHDDSLKNVTSVNITTKLTRISNKGNNASAEIVIGTSSVPVNFNNSEMIPAICIGEREFNLVGVDPVGSSYQLIFDIVDTSSTTSNRKDTFNGPPPAKLPCFSKAYVADLLVFDKTGNNKVFNGIYEILAKEERGYGNLDPSKGEMIQEWLAAQDDMNYIEAEIANPFEAFEKEPKVHMCCEWSKEPLNGRNSKIKKPKIIFDQQNNNNNKENLPLSKKVEKKMNGLARDVVKSEENKPCLIQFVVNPTTKQRTEERYDYSCPWCNLKCPQLHGLIFHLRLCHSRMSFRLVDEGTKFRIDVHLNEAGSTSYEGAPHRLLTGAAKGPTRKSVMNQLLVAGRHRRPKFDLTELQENEDFDQQHHFISGHNRIYYHTDTCIPIMPKELDYDSEGEPDPEWLQKTTKQMIDEFTDVNDGEKELMKLWNLHCMKNLFVGDCHVLLACEMFVKDKGEEILKKNLKRNYLTHLQSMSDFGLLSTAFILKNYKSLLDLEEQIMDPNIAKAQRKEHVRSWEEKNKTQSKGDKDRSKPTPANITPSKRRSENRLSKSALTPKFSLDDKNKSKSRKSSS